MTVTCPNGHQSSATDFCDTCGAKIDPTGSTAVEPAAPDTATPPAAPGASAGQQCPNCHVESSPEALFCEACGYDFTTGAMPRGAGSAQAQTPAEEGTPAASESGPAPVPEQAPAGAEADTGGTGIPPATAPDWVAEVWIDPDWYAGQDAEEALPSPGLPTVVPITVKSALIGRVSASKGITPDIDCTTDSGVSRRHAQLTTDGTRWFVEDLRSSNGTYVGPAAGPLPDEPIPVGPKHELDADERIYVGAWTRIVVRRATDEEKVATTG
jgi:hypothetical protein